MAIIETTKISKNFDKTKWNWQFMKFEKEKKTAVDEISLSIEEGEFVGFLGPNGAGKTTFLKILSGVINPASGKAQVLGYTPWDRDPAFLQQIAIVMGQKNQLWWDLPAIDSYYLLKEVYAVPDKQFKKSLDKMVETVGMKDLLKKRLRDMSLGERMKCELVACFLHDPKVIFLDEPTIGLDVVSAQNIRDFLREINKEKGCTIILTSHYMADIEALCPRIVIINKGSKIYDGSIVDLKEEYSGERKLEIYLADLEDKKKFARIKAANKNLSGDKGIIRVSKGDMSKVVAQVFDSFKIENISISDTDIEEIITKIFKSKN